MRAQNSSVTDFGNQKTANEPRRRSARIKVISAVSLAIAVYGMVEWLYVAVCSLVVPSVLPLPLTHLLPHFRADTSGVISFTLSFIGFTVYLILRGT